MKKVIHIVKEAKISKKVSYTPSYQQYPHESMWKEWFT